MENGSWVRRGRLLSFAIYGGVFVAMMAGAGCARAQQAGAVAVASPTSVEATRVKMTALRDQYVAQLKADGFTCPIAPPKILVEDVPSLGQYQDETNTLRTSDFSLLNPQERAFMESLAGPGASEAEMRVVFEKAAHQWIFVHEFGHWWQACQGFIPTHSHYQVESGANRIAMAYWREKDPSVVALMMRLFRQVLAQMPSPVPAGQTVEGYFNANYETLGPSPTYPWFQSQMNAALWNEKPEPSLKQAWAETRR